jgi:sigma-B regulation protein RsbU (phosphoserine phosphatase)
MESPSYGSSRIELEPGDCLLLYTDGVSDALNARNEPFKVQGIRTIIGGTEPITPQSLGQRLVKAVESHSAGRSQYDDLTLITFGRTS